MLRLMDRYIGKQIAAATIFGVVVLSVLLVMGNLFKELRPLLVEEHASPALVARFNFVRVMATTENAPSTRRSASFIRSGIFF